jgi:hypothetical protein
MRYLKSFLVGLGMYLLAVVAWDEFGWYLQVRWRHEHIIVAERVFRVGSKWDDFYVMLPMIIGNLIGIAGFVAGFYWMFRRTSVRNSN